MWRRDDVVSTVERERAEARKAETQQRSSWFSWRRSSSSKEDAFEDDGSDEGDVTTAQIEELMNRDDEGECKVGGEFLRVRLSTSLTCTVSHNRSDLASLRMSGSISAKATAGRVGRRDGGFNTVRFGGYDGHAFEKRYSERRVHHQTGRGAFTSGVRES